MSSFHRPVERAFNSISISLSSFSLQFSSAFVCDKVAAPFVVVVVAFMENARGFRKERVGRGCGGGAGRGESITRNEGSEGTSVSSSGGKTGKESGQKHRWPRETNKHWQTTDCESAVDCCNKKRREKKSLCGGKAGGKQ